MAEAPLKLGSDEKEFLALTGFLYLRYGRWEEARTIFEALQLLYPEDASVCKSLSFTCLKAGDYTRALEQAERFLGGAREPGDLQFGQLLKSKALWGLGDLEGARKLFKRASDIRE